MKYGSRRHKSNLVTFRLHSSASTGLRSAVTNKCPAKRQLRGNILSNFNVCNGSEWVYGATNLTTSSKDCRRPFSDFERLRWTVNHFGQLSFDLRHFHSEDKLKESPFGMTRTNQCRCSSRKNLQSIDKMITIAFSSTLMSNGFTNREEISSTYCRIGSAFLPR